MERPMTTEEFFVKIKNILEEKGLLPELLEYALPTRKPISIQTEQFELKNNLDYGGSEGIYLDLGIAYWEGEKKYKTYLGTFKTLQRNSEAMHEMANLLADFIVEATRYVNTNLEEFNWEGTDVYAIEASGKRAAFSYTCSTKEAARKRKDLLLESYPCVVLRDNATRKETRYERPEKEKDRKPLKKS